MLSVARADAKRAGVPMRFVVADAMNLGFGNSSFDTVVSSRMLMHVPEWKSALAELLRVARNTVIFDFPPTTSFAVVDVTIKRVKRALGSDTWTHRTLRIADVQREVEKHGWRVVVSKKDWFLPVALHRKLDDPALTERLENLCSRLGLRRLFGAPVTFKAVRVAAPKPARVAARRDPQPQEVRA
jgi:ubiquinone/menaquinone biosynthesis C-methylase UbiE